MDELDTAQRDTRIHLLARLVSSCRRRYLDSAALLQIESPSVQDLRDSEKWHAIDLRPLSPFYEVICRRYRDEQHDPQIPLGGLATDAFLHAWTGFFHHRLLPLLVWDAGFVRNVLRALRALPWIDREDPIEAILFHCREMALPNVPEPHDPDRRVDA